MTSPRTRTLVAALAVAALAAVLVTSVASGARRGHAVKTRHDASLGTILVAKNGRTLYHRSDETSHHFTCTGSCLALWPPLLVRSRSSVAHSGIRGLTTVRRPDNHKLQAVYKGKPLYEFANDRRAGDTKGQGFQGIWFVLAVKKPASSSPAPPASTTPSNPYSGYPGY